MKTLLTGKKYTPSAETNLWKTFQRIKKELKEEQKKKEVSRIFKINRTGT